MDEPGAFHGVVHRQRYAPGSKSEHDAVVLETDEGRRYLLRRPGANPFDDTELAALDGAEVRAVGRVHRDVLLVEQVERVTGSGSRHPGGPDEPPPSVPPGSPPLPR